MTIPTIIKPIIHKILIEAIQNSTSPKNLTAKKFKPTIETQKIEIQMATFKSDQYWITKAAAVISAGAIRALA